MIRLRNLIEHIFTKKNIKIFLLLFIVLGFFFGSGFAADGEETMDWASRAVYIVNIMISILSWLWILLATLAGKLMTNGLVYGTFLHMDKILRNLWNLMKNFANFTLGFILIFTIVKNLFSIVKSDAKPLKNAIDTVKNILIAGVLVQMSWFLVGAAFDLSNVATALVGSIPSQIISNNTSNMQRNMSLLLKGNRTKLTVNLNQSDTVKSMSTGEMSDFEINQFLDTVTPTANSVVGPLLFLGGSVFDLFEASDTSHNTDGKAGRDDVFLTIGVNGFVILAFTIMLAFMFIFNLFRVITLRIIIPLSPFIIFMQFLNPKGDKLKIEKFLGEILSVKNALKLIFKPVYMTLVLSIVLIVMTLVKGLAKNNNSNFHGGTYDVDITTTKVGSGYDSTLNVDGLIDVTLAGSKNTIVDLIIYITGLILMMMLMKSCVTSKTGIKFVDDKMDNLSKSLWGDKVGQLGGILGSVGVVPVGDGKKVGISKFNEFRDNVFGDSAESNGNAWARKMGINIGQQQAAVENFFGGAASFESLKTGSDVDIQKFLEEAVKIGRSMSLRDAAAIYSDDTFITKRIEWQKNHGNQEIEKKHIENVWKGDPWNKGLSGDNANGSSSNETKS